MGYDVIVVGARVAASATGMLLPRKGLRVLVIDRATFPSDTLSSHQLQTPGVARMRRWGLLDRLQAAGVREAGPRAAACCGAAARASDEGGRLGSPVGKDHRRARALDRGERLEHDPFPIQPAVAGRRLDHRVLAADVVGGDRDG